jgi:hypothetical protein
LSLKGRFVVLNSIHLEGQGSHQLSPPSHQPPAVCRQPPAAFTLEGWNILFWIRV